MAEANIIKDILDCKKIISFLECDVDNQIQIKIFDKTDSTNLLAEEYALSGEKEGCLVIAGEQTCGKGRMGRQFFSPGNTGVYMSLLLRPEIPPQDAIQITTAAAVSVCEAMEKIGVEKAQIKWVNDIFVNHKKVCGILTKASFNPQKNTLNYAILGVGVNMYYPDNGFPEDLKDIAGAVFSNKKENLRNEFVAAFINSFMYYYKNIEKKYHCEKYAERCFVTGRDINVISTTDIRPARALSVDENCGLLVEFETGEKAVLNSGEISIRVI